MPFKSMTRINIESYNVGFDWGREEKVKQLPSQRKLKAAGKTFLFFLLLLRLAGAADEKRTLKIATKFSAF